LSMANPELEILHNKASSTVHKTTLATRPIYFRDGKKEHNAIR
jgi:hypothetical protein